MTMPAPDYPDARKYTFGEFVLDASRGALARSGREIKLRPKVYDALLYLLDNRGRLVGKEELNQALWPNAFVTDDSLVQCLVELRRALGESAQDYLKTVPRRGYIFAAVADGPDTRRALAETQGGRKAPAARTPLIGRERELAGVKHALLDPAVRLVTLTGAGGSGKTRLALEAALELETAFEAGVYFVSLASIANPDLVAAAVAEAMGIPESGGRRFDALLKEHLGESGASPVLLALDNFEHILPAATLVVDLLESSAALKVMATSREPLRVYGEHEFPVPPLMLPDVRQLESPDTILSNPAVRLFAQRAAAVKPDFVVTAENAREVAQICSRVDGLPLAIELAAARVKMLSPHAMLARLESRLQLLTAGARDLPARQQTLRKTIDWSYDLLNEAEQKLLRRLGVFSGGATLEGAEAVCDTRMDLGAPVFDLMASLVDKSLVVQADASLEEPRFTMLETIREYCLERLGEDGEGWAVRRAHAAYCLVLAEEGNPDLSESDRAAWLARCDLEHDNFRAALDWLFETGDLEWAFRLCFALFRFWEMREHLAEGRVRLEAVFRLSGPQYDRQRAKASHYLGALVTSQGDFAAADDFAEQSLWLYRGLEDDWGIAIAWNARAIAAREREDYAVSQSHFEEALACFRSLGDRVAIARCLNNLANVVKARGNYPRARALLQEAAHIFDRLGDRSGAAWSLSQQGDVAREQNDLPAARDCYQQALAAFRAAGDWWGVARSLTDLGSVACEQRDHGAAHSSYRESLEIFANLGHKRGIALALEGFACSAWVREDARRALSIAAAAARVREQIGAPLSPLEQRKFDQSLRAAWSALEESESKAAWERGRSMSLEEAIQYSRETPGYASPA